MNSLLKREMRRNEIFENLYFKEIEKKNIVYNEVKNIILNHKPDVFYSQFVKFEDNDRRYFMEEIQNSQVIDRLIDDKLTLNKLG